MDMVNINEELMDIHIDNEGKIKAIEKKINTKIILIRR